MIMFISYLESKLLGHHAQFIIRKPVFVEFIYFRSKKRNKTAIKESLACPFVFFFSFVNAFLVFA